MYVIKVCGLIRQIIACGTKKWENAKQCVQNLRTANRKRIWEVNKIKAICWKNYYTM